MNSDRINKMSRRIFLTTAGAVAAGAILKLRSGVHTVEAKSTLPPTVSIVEFSDSGVRKSIETVPTVVHSDAEWKKQLSSSAFEITRRAGTEYPYSGSTWNLHDKGVYRCICCDTALFDSSTKFESGTGWPSFWQPIAKENVHEISDSSLGMERTAVSCKRCDAHLGHVFDDGPKPTGLRYCMNSVAMRFAKAA